MKRRLARARTRVALLLAAVLALPLWGATVAVGAAADQSGDIGFRGPSYAGAGITAPTGEKPESKLWFNDGQWWASMLHLDTSSSHIFRLDQSASPKRWVDTGTRIDDRRNTLTDTLWTGSKLYVASHVKASSNTAATSGQPARMYRYSYNSQTDSYSLDAGFPSNINNYSSETLTIDADGTGRLWATWAQQQKVYVTSSTDGSSWATPYVLPVASATGIDPDDISTLVAFKGRTGVMWSSQTESKVYFSFRNNGDGLTTWQPTVAVTVPGKNQADDHLNIKELQSDPDGRVFAVIKTSLDGSGTGSDPQIVVLGRSSSGTWSRATFGTVADCHTRPTLMLDSTNNLVRVFATAPNSGCPYAGSAGTIFEKDSPMSSLSFPTGRGTAIIRDSASPNLNNVSSSKQTVNAGTGLALLASNDVTKTYWSAYESLGTPSPTLAASFSGSPTSGTSPLKVTFSDTSAGDPVAWTWDFGDGGTSTDQNPTHIYSQAGNYTVKLTVKDAQGRSDTATRSNYVTVTGAPSVKTISIVGSTSNYASSASNLVTLARPSGVSSGDVVVASLTVDNNGSVSAPSGWTAMVNGLSINSSSSTGARVYAYYRVVGGSEPASYSFGLSSGQKWGAGLTAYRGVDTATPLAASVVTATDTTYNSSSLTLPSITTSVDDAQLVGGLGLDSGSASVSAPSGWTERWEASGQVAELADRAQASRGSSGTATWTLSGVRSSGGWRTALRPAQ